ncbi:tuberin [Melanomma pulvis-pyrius CBS 109.77]|uniref:Tuberin n=1 Tax=Melanomma pulvis-pyrius CBS 109.77 TaxID=1314802 RepID=A0A6A6X4W1_9PLEO|nr:tuberin [Melanomma pulvis-pyrius CBS 109.77]
MSPSSGNVPHTPDRRASSSTLFGAFRSLTAGRLRSPTPPTPGSPATTPTRTPSLAALRPEPVASGPLDAIVNRTAQQVAQNNESGVHGGPPELHGLVAQLHSSHSLQQRALAIDKITSILETYPVRNVLGLWAVASDLLLPEQPDEAAAAGYKLLKGCVSLPDLTPVERNVFFSAASLRKADSSFHLRLDIVSTLTDGGKNIEACESSLATFVLSSLDVRFKESRHAYKAARKANPKKKIDLPTKEGEDLARLFHYTTEISRFNSKIFSEDDLEQLLIKTMAICQETEQHSDIQNAIKLFDVVVTYIYVPSQILKPFLEVLCIIHRQLGNLQEQAWSTLSNLFKSHVGQAAVSALLDTLHHGPYRKSRQFPVYRGVIQILQRLLLEDGRNGLPAVSVSLLLPALKSSIHGEHESQEEFVVDLVHTILAEERMRELLRNETDWNVLIDIIYICVGRDDSRRAHAAAEKGAADKLTTEKATSAAGRSSLPDAIGTAVSAASTTGEPDGDVTSNADASAIPPARTELPRRNSQDSISKLLTKLDEISDNLDIVQKAAIVELFLRFAYRLSDSTAENMIRFYAEERYLQPSNPDWLETCRTMVASIVKDETRPRLLRILCVQTLRETYETVACLCASDTILQLATLLLNNIEAEEDVQVLNELVDFAVDIADQASDPGFVNITTLLKRRIDRPRVSPPPAAKSPSWTTPTLQSNTDKQLGTPCNVIATAFVRLFTRSVTTSARRIRILYEILRHIARSDAVDSDARLTTLKLLFRLRADFKHGLIVSASSEGERIAAVLWRTAETAIVYDETNGSALVDTGKHEDHVSWRDQRKVSGSSPHSSLNRQTGRQTNAAGRVSKPVPPLWMYPGPKGLPEEPSSEPSGVVFSHIDAEEYPLSDDVLDLEVTLWLELIISLLQKAPDWEVYSYVLVHLGPQLSNQSLVRSCVPQLKMLRSVICEQIRNSTFHEPPGYTLLKKADVAVCLFHVLTVLISYHDHYEKSEEDDLVKTFLHGIAFWDRTSNWCIHALTVCCHETPLSVGKSLDNIVQKMSTIVTKPSTAIHILEFLTSVARMPELYKNFREPEFKMVFGVSFRYLQHIRDQRDRAAVSSSSQNNHRSLKHSGASRDFSASPDPNASKTIKSAADDLPQYLYSLAYHVITFWFMGLRMEDRPKHIPWITKNLYYTDSTGRQIMEEQGQVILDMMSMVAYSDRDETIRDDHFATPGDGEVWKKTWIVGHSLVTIETATTTGVSMTTSRRPCGTRYLYTRPLLAPPPRHQAPLTVGPTSEGFSTSSYVDIMPDDIFQTYYAPLNLSDPPIPLPDDDMTRRAIAAFDHNATVDSHKVGVIYIGEGQTNEREILMNTLGSEPYSSFLQDLGTLVRLKDAKFNTGGLDFRNDQDGKYTFCWRDRCMELIFHIPTMMPTDPDDDMTYPNKKRHIGNDYVNIIWNDSGLPYNFDTFPSAFNYVHIVITPESKASFVDGRLAPDPDGKNRYYKIQVVSRPGFPDISPAVESKIICGKYLAAYCRLIAINANVFSQVWSIREGGESVSSWRNRLREIKRLRERYGANDTPAPSPSSPVHHQGLSSPPPRENGNKPFNRTSVATFISEGTSRSSITSSSQDVAL